MAAHIPKYLFIGEPEAHKVRCSCRWVSHSYPNKNDAEDEYAKHMRVVERVRTHLHTNPTLRGQRDYYLEMSTDTSVTEADRNLWRQLADEISHRLNDGPPGDEQLRLL